MKKSLFFILGLALCVTACSSSYTGEDFDRDSEYMDADNQYADVDSYRPKNEEDFEKQAKRWDTARKETRWQEYKGTMVRVEVLLGNTDTRNMRLRLIQNADGMDVDGDSRTILSHVAEYEMKRVCGRNVESIVKIYDKPSYEVVRPTSYFDYRVEAEGSTMREYGFRCVYRK
ncbi:MAG: hypothetical protein MJ156_00855 [Alphaproteobacteria bacterium]|nr:hypothetical protein [Alphaproteobacteria bacterium]